MAEDVAATERAARPARPSPMDVALAVVIGALGLVEALATNETAAVLVVGPIAMSAPLVARRTHPMTALGLVLMVFVALVVEAGRASELGVQALVCVSVAIASAASWVDRRRVAIGAFVVSTAAAMTDIVFINREPADAPFGLVLVAGAWTVGRLLRSNRLRNAELALRNRQLAQERDARARAAVAEERTRIARELHDVVGHAVTVMVVQTGAAQQVLREDPDRAAQALEAIAAAGREALAEMRRTVGLLRQLDQQPDRQDALGPQPGLRDLDRLAERVRASGLQVELELPDEPVELPAGLELSAFRIVQEALTNVGRHSRAERARVAVRRHPGVLDLRVEDPGPPAAEPAAEGDEPRHGLTGMRERAALYGGSLYAAPTAAGGFVVHARLPIGAVDG